MLEGSGNTKKCRKHRSEFESTELSYRDKTRLAHLMNPNFTTINW